MSRFGWGGGGFHSWAASEYAREYYYHFHIVLPPPFSACGRLLYVVAMPASPFLSHIRAPEKVLCLKIAQWNNALTSASIQLSSSFLFCSLHKGKLRLSLSPSSFLGERWPKQEWAPNSAIIFAPWFNFLAFIAVGMGFDNVFYFLCTVL